jgi:hypothetical protein
LHVIVQPPSEHPDVAFQSAGQGSQSVSVQPTVGPGSTQTPPQRFCVAVHSVMPVPPVPGSLVPALPGGGAGLMPPQPPFGPLPPLPLLPLLPLLLPP